MLSIAMVLVLFVEAHPEQKAESFDGALNCSVVMVCFRITCQLMLQLNLNCRWEWRSSTMSARVSSYCGSGWLICQYCASAQTTTMATRHAQCKRCATCHAGSSNKQYSNATASASSCVDKHNRYTGVSCGTISV